MSSEIKKPVLNSEKCNVVLLDVAGTTTSNSFLKDTLFTYVCKQAEEFLKQSWDNESVKEAVKYLKNDAIELQEAVTLVKELTDENSDNKGLKIIQGLIYKKGYESGDLKAHVFSDVPTSFESWSKALKVAIYSTGSIESQRLLFSHTLEGDLSVHISKYFDQSIGNKTESSSYRKIAKELGVKAEEIIFITDNITEAKAAKSAGIVTAVIEREGNDLLPEKTSKEFSIISSFENIVFDKLAKRKEIDEPISTKVQSNKSRRH